MSFLVWVIPREVWFEFDPVTSTAEKLADSAFPSHAVVMPPTSSPPCFDPPPTCLPTPSICQFSVGFRRTPARARFERHGRISRTLFGIPRGLQKDAAASFIDSLRSPPGPGRCGCIFNASQGPRRGSVKGGGGPSKALSKMRPRLSRPLAPGAPPGPCERCGCVFRALLWPRRGSL